MTGTVISVVGRGTIISVGILDDESGAVEYVHFNHTPFRNIVEDEGTVIGRRVTVERDLGEQTLTFEN